MAHPQTQHERRPAPSRRVVATGSTLLAVMILLSMLPPGAGVVAAAVTTDTAVELVQRSTHDPQRRDQRSVRATSKVVKLAVAKLRALTAQPCLAPTTTADAARLAAAAPRVHLNDEPALAGPRLVRQALLALPPPAALI